MPNGATRAGDHSERGSLLCLGGVPFPGTGRQAGEWGATGWSRLSCAYLFLFYKFAVNGGPIRYITYNRDRHFLTIIFSRLKDEESTRSLRIKLIRRASLYSGVRSSERFYFGVVRRVIRTLSVFGQRISGSNLGRSTSTVFAVSSRRFRFNGLIFTSHVGRLIGRQRGHLVSILRRIFFLVNRGHFIPVDLVFGFFGGILSFGLRSFASWWRRELVSVLGIGLRDIGPSMVGLPV